MYYKSTRPRGSHIASITLEELTVAVKVSGSFTQLMRNLGFADGDAARIKVKEKLKVFNIDISHFSSKRKAAPDHIKKARMKERDKRFRVKIALKRKNPKYRANFILQDSKTLDRKHGFGKTDLTVDYINSLISQPCIYCEETNLMMTLDRIDNQKGHVKDNVNQSCIRCNLLRRDMPHEAWLLISPALKKIREENKFGTWTGELRKKE